MGNQAAKKSMNLSVLRFKFFDSNNLRLVFPRFNPAVDQNTVNKVNFQSVETFFWFGYFL